LEFLSSQHTLSTMVNGGYPDSNTTAILKEVWEETE
jgi:hypothetical protein